MEPEEIKSLRKTLGENAKKFGKRFARGTRAVEDWEQGRRTPDPLVMQLLQRLKRRIDRQQIENG